MNSALKMSQVVVISILLAGCFASAQSASFSVLNSIGQGCYENGTCYEVCEYEDIKLMPGHAEPNTGKCIAVFCNEDFVVDVHTCHELKDSSCRGKYGHNYKKPFPDCCNQFCQSIVQLDDDKEQIQLINPVDSSSMQYSESYK